VDQQRVLYKSWIEQFLELSLEMVEHTKGGNFEEAMRTFPSAKFHRWCELGRQLENYRADRV